MVPYVAARQFLVLRRDGLPTAFAGWVLESDAGDRPWRCDHYLPARIEIAQPGRPCVTQVISPYLSPGAVVTAVARTLGLTAPPPWIAGLPVVGQELETFWRRLAQDTGEFAELLKSQLIELRYWAIGSGLAIVPFLHGGVVTRFQWLTEQQFLDAVAKLGLHERSARDFFDALVAMKVLERDASGRYANTPETQIFLVRGRPSYVGGLLEMANARLYESWGHLSQALADARQERVGRDGDAAVG